MLTFACPSCGQTYSVPDDRAGMAASCKRCGTAMRVPGAGEPDWLEEPDAPASRRVRAEPAGKHVAARSRPPLRAVLALAGMFVAGLVVIGLLVAALYAVSPRPSKQTVEARLTDSVPRGFVLLNITDYDRKTGWLKFWVTYPDLDPVGVKYDVERTRAYGKGTYEQPEWNVRVTCRRCGPNGLTLLDAEFDKAGGMHRKRSLAPIERALERLYEEQARGIAQAVFELR